MQPGEKVSFAGGSARMGMPERTADVMYFLYRCQYDTIVISFVMLLRCGLNHVMGFIPPLERCMQLEMQLSLLVCRFHAYRTASQCSNMWCLHYMWNHKLAESES
jgi:hypothetical protein